MIGVRVRLRVRVRKEDSHNHVDVLSNYGLDVGFIMKT